MTTLAAISLSAILFFLASLHVYWAAGGRWGMPSTLPQTSEGRPVISPGPLLTVVVALLLLIAGLIVVGAASLIELPVSPKWLNAGAWLLGGVFFLRAIGDFRYVGFSKRVRGTTFARWDTRLFSPLCLVMSLLAWIVAGGS